MINVLQLHNIIILRNNIIRLSKYNNNYSRTIILIRRNIGKI